jgi:hypothetical protein
MRKDRVTPVVLVLLLAAGTAWALSEPVSEDLEANRALLNEIRHDRVHHARLLREAQAYNHLAPEVRARIQLLDRDVQAEPSAEQVRLLHAAERYSTWLASLPPEERTRIEAERDKDRRLALIKEIRQRQWAERLPPPLRERVQKAKDSDRPAVVSQLRSEEKRWRNDWQLATRHWDAMTADALPNRLDKLPPEAQTFVTKELMPRLHQDERDRLAKVEGQWPQYPRMLVELVGNERIGFRLLMPLQGPSKWDDVPVDFQRKIRQLKLVDGTRRRLMNLQGQWPEFALVLTEVAKRNNIPLPRQFGPCLPREFDKPVREFIHQKLMRFNTSVLVKDELERLKSAEGLWPLYPKTVWELAHKHHLDIPGASLPGPPGYWDSYRDHSGTADERSFVSDLVLRVFLETELIDAERAELGVALSDPVVRERVQQEFIKRHPEDWQKIVEADKQKRGKKASKAAAGG